MSSLKGIQWEQTFLLYLDLKWALTDHDNINWRLI